MRSVPTPDWARGSEAYVAPSSSTSTLGGQERVQAILKTGVEEDLRAAGVFVVSQERGKGELDIFFGDYESWAETISVRLQREGRELDRFTVKTSDLPCLPGAFQDDVFNLKMRCVAREIALRTLESRPVAAAMQRTPAPLAAQAAAPGRTLSGKLAVLELRNFAKDLTKQNAQYFTDVVRIVALKTQPQLEVMTRENLLVLLRASGKPIEDCEGECEVDTGRRIGADEIVSGEIQKLGSLYKLSLRLHDTHEGRLLASTQASGKTIEELDRAVQKAAEDLLGGR